MTRKKCLHKTFTTLFILLTSIPALAGPGHDPGVTGPRISIIIDDIGYRWVEDHDALDLPGPLAFSIMPHSPNARLMSRLAVAHGKDVLLHLPMEALEEDKNRFLGPGALTLDMTRGQFLKTLHDDLQSFPNIIGVNNHMGSLLTQFPGQMEWLMKSLRDRGIFYVDSLTSSNSVAGTVARESRVSYQSRDIFLDDEVNVRHINTQFDNLLRIARQRGEAIAIGHPHPETLSVLRQRLAGLGREGVILVSLTELIRKPPETPQLLLTSHP